VSEGKVEVVSRASREVRDVPITDLTAHFENLISAK